MSVTSALYTGVSGLKSNGESMNVIGNNISNVNTIGFKSSRTLFSDMLSANIGNNSQIGRGVQIQKVDNIFGQGSFQSTELTTDLAIQGDSFFALKDPNASSPVNQNGALLTRAGAFRLDDSLNLVNPDGYQVLDTQGNPIQFSDNAADLATANAALTAATDAANTTYNTSVATAYQTQAATMVTSAGTLAAAIAADPGHTAADTAAATALQTAATAAKTAADTAAGNPTDANVAAAQTAFDDLTTLAGSSSFSVAAADVATFNASLTTANATNDSAVTTAAATLAADPTVAAAQTQLSTAKGLAFGKIVSVDPSGLITYLGQDGLTTNYYNTSGQVGVPANTANAATVQRLAVINVANPGGLDKFGGTLFKATADSGVPATSFSLAENTANGNSEKINTNSLELSNVDLASEFVNMITTQRAYSANSKTIMTVDEMTQEVLNIKR
jgi:flagellar hook protein FlgE